MKTLTPFFLVILFAFASFGQTLNNTFRQISTIDGLSSPIVNVTFKDSRGYLWFGTVDGLNRYNGYSIDIYRNEDGNPNSISGNVITSIDESLDGRLIIGTRFTGVNIYDPLYDKFESIDPVKSGLKPGSITDIEIVDENLVLLSSQGGGLISLTLSDKKLSAWTHKPNNSESISNDIVLSILKNDENSYWIGTNSGGVDLFNIKTKKFRHYIYDQGYALDLANRKPLLLDRQKNLWIGTDGQGLYKLNRKSQRFQSFTKSTSKVSADIITALYEDDQGFIYAGTDGYGIDVINPRNNNFQNISNSIINDRSLSSDAVYGIYEDNSSNVYISTFRGGVNIFSPKMTQFTHLRQIYMEENSLSFNSVISLEAGKDGNIWIGTDGGGLDLYDPKSGNFKHFTHDPNNPRTLSSNVITSLQEDQNGIIWAGTYAAGLNKLNMQTGNVVRYASDMAQLNSLGSRNVWDMLVDKDGTLWLGLLDGGLDRYNRATDDFTHFRNDPGNRKSISSNLVLCMIEDPMGKIWIGTEDQGLNLFDKQQGVFIHFKATADRTSLRDNNVRTLSIAPNGRLWAGTSNGISIVDTQSREISDAKVNELLPNQVISGIRFDNSGAVWISHGRGLSKYSPSLHSIDNYTIEDGLQGIDFNYDADVVSPTTGYFYFAGVNGMNEFDPAKIRKSTFEPELVITDIKLFGISLQNDSTNQKQLNFWDSLDLTYDQNALTFEFASLDYSSVNSLQYKYLLEGFDKDWTFLPSGQRSANYTNLDPGSYTLHIVGSNADGIWSSKDKIIYISISPPWWKTWWFRLAIILIAITAVLVVTRWRVNAIRIQRKTLERKVKEATEQVKSQNQELVKEQLNLQEAINETNEIVGAAVASGDFSARLDISNKTGEWLILGESINKLFDSIMVPFQSINAVINELSKKDLTIRYQDEAKGDIAALTDNLNVALSTLDSLLSEIQVQSNVINEGSQTMQSSAQEMNLNTAEISSSISQMAQGASSQVEKIDESSQLLEQILKLSGEISTQASGILTVAKSGVDQSQVGTQTIHHLDKMMKEIKSISSVTNESMQLLINQSREISQIISMIKEISNETNLLSLNATIEAAKAGENGRGFAVIANQIRILSEDTTTSSKQIEQSIQQIQLAISTAEKQITEMVGSISKGEQAAQEAITSFDQLSDQSTESLQLSKQILSSTQEQNSNVQKVVNFMEGVVVISEQTAAGTEEIAASAQELSSGMSEFARNSDEVSQIVSNLSEQLDQFTLNQEKEP